MKDLRDLMLAGVKSYDKVIPTRYRFATVQQRVELLRGLMDTDGSCSCGVSEFCTTSGQLANDVVTLVRSLGGIATVYAHQSSMAVSAGQKVSQGQVIGYVGCTGYCTGPHLHFEVRVNGRPVDPGGYVGG